ncbi:5079_t:CDS:2 [Scutellospora calospora]|uniref:5079_t:CDS:1 n=1 Tax=Scutellospora calospora TaxID=85575 RepID=A0ACA9KWC5_9GLOM|nr:5079_t:CDS:2 [Scutellospora calospora]
MSKTDLAECPEEYSTPVILPEVCSEECIAPVIQSTAFPAECLCPVIQPAPCPAGCPIPKMISGTCSSNNEIQIASKESHDLEECYDQVQQLEILGQKENNFNVILRRDPLLIDLCDDLESDNISCDVQEEEQCSKGHQSSFIHTGTPITTGCYCSPQDNAVFETELPIGELLKRRIRKFRLVRRQAITPPCMYTEDCNLEHDEANAHGYQEDYEDILGSQNEGFTNCDIETGLTYGDYCN